MSKPEETRNEQLEKRVLAGLELVEQAEREYKKALLMRCYKSAEKYYLFWESMRNFIYGILNMEVVEDKEAQFFPKPDGEPYVAFRGTRADGAVRIPEKIWEEWDLTGGAAVCMSPQSNRCFLLLKEPIPNLKCISCTVTDDAYLRLPESIAEPEKDVIYRFDPFLSGAYSLHKIYRSELTETFDAR